MQRHDQFAKLFASDWYRDLDRRIQQAGFRLIMAGAFSGARHMIADWPIRTPADLAGITVRVLPNTMWIETFRAMGARPTMVRWSEVYNALAQGVVQAAEPPQRSLWGARLHEVKKTISTIAHFIATTAWPINNGYFSRLPRDVQDLLLEEGAKGGAEQTRLTRAMEEDFIARFKGAGVTVLTDVDLAAFQRATVAVYSAFPRWTLNLQQTVSRVLAS